MVATWALAPRSGERAQDSTNNLDRVRGAANCPSPQPSPRSLRSRGEGAHRVCCTRARFTATEGPGNHSADHSALMPVSLMMGPHFSVSNATRLASSLGVDTVTGAPIAAYLCLTDACVSAATASA